MCLRLSLSLLGQAKVSGQNRGQFTGISAWRERGPRRKTSQGRSRGCWAQPMGKERFQACSVVAADTMLLEGSAVDP